MTSSRLDKMKHAVAKGMWKRLENLMRPEERALFLAIFDSGSYSCRHIPSAVFECIERVLIDIGLLGAPENPAELAELTDKGRIFARYTDPMHKDVAGMEDRINLLKSLVDKQDWEALYKTLYTNERETFMWISDPSEHDIHLPPAALDECISTLIKCGLAISGTGPVSLTLDGEHLLNYLTSMTPTNVTPDYPVKPSSEKADEGSEPVPPRVRELNTLLMVGTWGELWDRLLDKEKNLILCLSDIGDPSRTPRVHEVETEVLRVLTLTGLVAVCGENLYLTRTGATLACHRAVAAFKKIVDNVGQPIHENCLEEAGKIVRGSREDTYGPAERNLSRIAKMWSAYLSVPLTARQVAVMMVLLKASRDAFKPKHDNMVDICGYAYLADMIDNDMAIK